MNLRLSFPVGIAERLEKMALEREMKVEDMVAELVEVALISLKDPPAQLEAWARNGGPPEFDLPDPGV